jgi:DNA-directed RNA polymerase subunit M/transcription elongation factor TFIIS
MEYRKRGKSLLNQLIKSEKNCSILEKNIHERWSTEELYNNVVYECMCLLDKGKTTANVLAQIKTGRMGWSNPEFDDIAFQQKEQDDFTISPFQVEEGVLKCPKCGGCKSFSYSKQTRSADEPMTTFATCVNCRHKWTYSG